MGTDEEEAGGGMEQSGGLMRMHRNKHGQDPMQVRPCTHFCDFGYPTIEDFWSDWEGGKEEGKFWWQGISQCSPSLSA